MVTLFDVLREIRKRPSMYLGGESPYGRDALVTLCHVLHGYNLALSVHDIDEPGKDFQRSFERYLRDEHAMPSSSLGFVATISGSLPSTTDVWSEFWRLVDEYEAYVSKQSSNDP